MTALKLAVFSDTHGDARALPPLIRAWRPDMVVHLGDYCRDGLELAERFPELDIRVVRGNCDLAATEPEKLLFSAEKATVFATHGHIYGVKYGLDALLNTASLAGAGLVLFGHTHRPLCRDYGGLIALNPGPSGRAAEPTWAQVEIELSGRITCRIVKV